MPIKSASVKPPVQFATLGEVLQEHYWTKELVLRVQIRCCTAWSSEPEGLLVLSKGFAGCMIDFYYSCCMCHWRERWCTQVSYSCLFINYLEEKRARSWVWAAATWRLTTRNNIINIKLWNLSLYRRLSREVGTVRAALITVKHWLQCRVRPKQQRGETDLKILSGLLWLIRVSHKYVGQHGQVGLSCGQSLHTDVITLINKLYVYSTF